MKRVLITGSRTWTNRRVIERALRDVSSEYAGKDITIVHGGAHGADTIAGEIAQSLGMFTEVHKADWRRYGKSAGAIRNRVMVDSGVQLCLAFPLGEARGTRDCMRVAEKVGIPVRVYKSIAKKRKGTR